MPEPTPHPDRRPVIALGRLFLAVALVVLGLPLVAISRLDVG